MTESENRDAVARIFKAADARDWTTMKDFYHSDAVEEWPQSGELLVGVANIMAVNENYPDHPTLQVRRILGAGNLVVGEAARLFGDEVPPGERARVRGREDQERSGLFL